MNPRRFGSFRGIGAAGAIFLLGLGVLTAPWLSVKGSIGDNGAVAGDPVEAAPGAGAVRGNGETSSRAAPPPLLIFPVPPAPPSRLASSAGAFSVPAPDGASVLNLERRLRELSYMTGAEDTVFDQSTRFGLTAFQKVENLPLTGEPDALTLSRLDTAQPPAPMYTTPPDHLEVDIPRQVVFVVRGGRVTETLPTSTGNGKIFRSQGRRSRAVTPNGQYAITYKRNGWRRSPLGLLYRPAYFNGGIAFHGAKSVPTSPASHGCVRLPMPFADWFADTASPPGMVVYVYGNPGEPNPAPLTAAAPPPAAGPPPGQVEAQPGAPPPDSPPLLGGLLGDRAP